MRPRKPGFIVMDAASKVFDLGQSLGGKLGSLVVAVAFSLFNIGRKMMGGSSFFHLTSVPRADYSYRFAKDVITQAESCGTTAGAYAERHYYKANGLADAVIKELKNAGALPPSTDVCEIGSGTGMYLDGVLSAVRPARYHIFETNLLLASYLEERYAPTIINHAANGVDLHDLATNTCGIVCCFGLFTILPIIQSFRYFEEMIRVCKPGGYIFFDCFLAESWDLEFLNSLLSRPYENYYVVLPEKLTCAFFRDRRCDIVHKFKATNISCGSGDIEECLVFQKLL